MWPKQAAAPSPLTKAPSPASSSALSSLTLCLSFVFVLGFGSSRHSQIGCLQLFCCFLPSFPFLLSSDHQSPLFFNFHDSEPSIPLPSSFFFFFGALVVRGTVCDVRVSVASRRTRAWIGTSFASFLRNRGLRFLSFQVGSQF